MYQFDGGSATYQLEAIYNCTPGQGISYLESQGTFYLDIEAEGEWVVKAVMVEEVG